MSDKMPDQDKSNNNDSTESDENAIVNSSENNPSDVEIEKAMEKMPPEMRKIVLSMFSSHRSSPACHPLVEKFEPSHIDKFLDNARQEDNNQYKLYSTNRWFKLGYTMMGLALFVFIIIYFKEDKESLFNILGYLTAFLGGFGSGYGYLKYQSD